jgi:hypothetical protein
MMPLLLAASAVLAGERTFAFAYGYGTVPKGGVELEQYTTAYGKEGSSTFFWEHQTELEYGISDRLEAGLYLVSGHWLDAPVEFRGYKAHLRYRFGSAAGTPFGANAYVEYIGRPGFDEHGVELKAIFAGEIKRFEWALNVEYEAEFGHGLVQEFEPTFGAGVHLARPVVVGLEGRFETYFRDSGTEGPYIFLGPSMHLAGQGGKVWWTLAVVAPVTPLTAEDEGVTVRSLVAINL